MEDNRDSCVIYKISSKLLGADYKNFITDLLEQFLLWADPNIDQIWAKHLSQSSPWNRESGLSMFHIGKTAIGQLKLYLYDGTNHGYPHLSKSIVFRDHYSPADVIIVYLVADKFEAFLKLREIDHARINRTR